MTSVLLSSPERRRQRGRSTAWSLLSPRAALLVLLGAIAAFHLATTHSGHSWNGDFALFLMHAQNLIEGAPYADTPYVLNGVNGNPSPHAYPPGFPLLLVPLLAVFGASIIPMKVFLIGCFVLALGLVAHLLRDALPPAYVLAVVALVGFNPVLADFLRTDVVSDIPFLLCVYLSLWALHRVHESTDPQALLWSGGAGLLIFAATLLRSLGLVLLPTLVLFDLVRHRWITRGTWITLGIFAAAYGGQTLLATQSSGAPAGGAEYYADLVQDSLLDQLTHLGWILAVSVRQYAQMLEGFFWGAETSSPVVRFVLSWVGNATVTVALAVGGWALHAWQRRSLIDVFVPVYVAALLPWNFHVARYLIPVLPFLVFYAAYALSFLPRLRGGRWAVALVAFFVVGSYGMQLTSASYHEDPTSALAPEAQALYHFLRTDTPPDALVVFGKPRFIALETGRRSMRWYAGGTNEEYLHFFAEKGVDYAVDGPRETEPYGRGRGPVVEHLAAAYPSHFEQVYRSPHYVVYRFRPPPGPAAVGEEPGGGTNARSSKSPSVDRP